MLVLTVKENECVLIGDDVKVMVLDVRFDGRVRLGIEAPPDIEVDRTVVRESKLRGRRAAS